MMILLRQAVGEEGFHGVPGEIVEVEHGDAVAAGGGRRWSHPARSGSTRPTHRMYRKTALVTSTSRGTVLRGLPRRTSIVGHTASEHSRQRQKPPPHSGVRSDRDPHTRSWNRTLHGGVHGGRRSPPAAAPSS